MKRKELVQLEVKVRKEDVSLVRSVAGALIDPNRDAEARAFLRSRFARPASEGLKELLAAAPLEGIELERQPDTDRLTDL